MRSEVNTDSPELLREAGNRTRRKDSQNSFLTSTALEIPGQKSRQEVFQVEIALEIEEMIRISTSASQSYSFLERLMVVFRRERDGATFLAEELVSDDLVCVQAHSNSHTQPAKHSCNQSTG